MDPKWIRDFVDNIPLSPWIIGPLAAALWLGLLLWVKRAVLRVVHHHLVQRMSWSWADWMIEALSPALSVLIVTGAIAILAWILPLGARSEQALYIGVVATVALALLIFTDRLCRRLLGSLMVRSPNLRGEQGLLQGLIRGVVIALAVMVFLDSIGISITPLIASLGIGTAAVALALQETLANLFAGIYIVTDRPVEAGHFISLEGGEEGYVEKVGWRSTHIRMVGDVIVVVPNSKLAGSVIKNYSLPRNELWVKVEVGVDYESDLERVEAVTMEVARAVMAEVDGAIREFQPILRFHTFADSSINFRIWIGAQDYLAGMKLKHEFIKRLHQRYRREGITIPWPVRTIEVGDRTVAKLREGFAGAGPATSGHPPGARNSRPF